MAKRLVKKGACFFVYKYKGFFTSNKFIKDDPTNVGFLNDLMLIVVKRSFPIKIIVFVWFQRLSYRLYS